MPVAPLSALASNLRNRLMPAAAILAVPMVVAGCAGASPALDAGARSSSGTESASTADPELERLLDAGTRSYTAFVRNQTALLVTGTQAFAEAYAAGDSATARELYASTRMYWERIEPVAESFGDLDPKLDAREADLEPGQEWTGWHRAEKDVFPPAATPH